MMSRGVFIERESGFLFDKDPPDWGGSLSKEYRLEKKQNQ